MKQDISYLTDSLVKDFAQYKGGSLVILADEGSMHIGKSILDSAFKVSAEILKSTHLIDLDDYRQGSALLEMSPLLEKEIELNLNTKVPGTNDFDLEHNLLIYLTPRLDGERENTFAKIHEMAEARGKLGGLPNCTVDVLTAGFHKDNIREFGDELYNFLLNEFIVNVKSDAGTDLDIVMRHHDDSNISAVDLAAQNAKASTQMYKLVHSNGILLPGKYANPIPGEVFAHPWTADGFLVIDASYGPLLGHKDYLNNHEKIKKDLAETPIIMEINNGLVTEVSCSNSKLEDFTNNEVFGKDKVNGPKIGEFGLPTNLYVLGRDLTGNLMIDEKGRVHIAHGHGYQNRTGCEYDTGVHGDGLISKATLTTNSGLVFMKNGEYSKEVFKTLKK